MAVLAESQGKLGFPFYFPALRKTGSRYADPEPRIYTIRDAQNKAHKAYRLVLYAGAYGEYYGVQGMAWKYPPILDDPDSTRTDERPQADALLRRQPPAPGRLAHPEGRLLDHEHADDVDPEQPPDRDRRFAAPPEVASREAPRARRCELAKHRPWAMRQWRLRFSQSPRSSRACGCRASWTR